MRVILLAGLVLLFGCGPPASVQKSTSSPAAAAPTNSGQYPKPVGDESARQSQRADDEKAINSATHRAP